jgi:gliding motility-associated-like protein
MSGAKRNLTFWRPTEPNNREDINPGRTVVQDCDPNYPGLWCDAEPLMEFVGLIETFYASPPTIPKIKSYLWSTGESSAEINLRDTSIKEISVLVTFENGLTKTFSKNVAQLWYDMPKEYNTLVKDLKLNEEVVLIAQNLGNYQYEWLPNTGLDNYYKKEANHLFKKDILYELKVTSKDNCFSYETFDLKGIDINESNEEILVPGIFSPNSDRINDLYLIETLDFIEDFSVVIFTREGKVIFESSDQNFRWDGSFNGVLQPSGLYGIRLKYKFNGQVKEFTRPLVIQR